MAPRSDPPGDGRHALRDLMGLLALPALWAGRDAPVILDIMGGAISRIVHVDVAFAEVRLDSKAEPTPMWRLGAGRWTPEMPAGWEAFTAACRSVELHSDRGLPIASPLGELRVLRFFMGAGARDERIWFGSRADGFPTLHDVAFMRAAVSLAVSGLQAAHVAQERTEALRAKDEFMALLGHELRNPLAPIVTALRLVRLKGAGHLAHEIDLIDRQVNHLTRLVDDLLDVTRITRDRVHLQLERFALREAVLAAVEMVEPLVEQRRHVLHVALGELAGRVEGDRHRLRQLFTNLLVNAAKYTPPGGEIRVTAQQDAGWAVVAVSDNGAGIEPDLLPRLFELFQQGTVSIDRSQGGLGIGLALVRKLVALHGGAVTASSEGPGRGATFTVRLPLVDAPAEEVAAPVPAVPAPAAAAVPAIQVAPAAASGADAVAAGVAPALPVPDDRAANGSLRVFLVDDNNDARETLGTLLDLLGHQVMTAGEAGEALAKAPGFAPDAIILDIGLPGMDGYQLAQAMRASPAASLRQARLIALTGYGQESDRARALAAGFDHHLVKPVQLDQLMVALKGE